MTDLEHHTKIKAAIEALRIAVDAALFDGLEVETRFSLNDYMRDLPSRKKRLRGLNDLTVIRKIS